MPVHALACELYERYHQTPSMNLHHARTPPVELRMLVKSTLRVTFIHITVTAFI